MTRSSVILKLFSLLFIVSIFFSQSRADKYEYQKANQFVTAGKNLEAKKILIELYKKYPHYNTFRTLYKKTLSNLADYTELIKVIQFELLKQRKNPILNAELIIAYHKLGSKEKATEILESIMSSMLKLEVQFVQVSNIMIRNRLYEYAIILYKEADSRFNKNGQYYYNIAYLHQRLQNYKDSFFSYLEYLEKDPKRFHSVSGRILNLMDQEDSKTAIIQNLDRLKGLEVFTKLKISILLVEEKYLDVFKVFRKERIRDETFIINVVNKIKTEASLSEGIEFLTILNEHYNGLKRIDTKELLISLYFNFYIKEFNELSKKVVASKIDSLVREFPGKNRVNFRINYIRHLLVDRFEIEKSERLLSSFLGDQTILQQEKVQKLIALLAFYKKDFQSAKAKFDYLENRRRDGWGAYYSSLITIINEDSVNIKNAINNLLRNKNGIKNRYLNDILSIAYTSKHNQNEQFKELLYKMSINDHFGALKVLGSFEKNELILKLSYQLSRQIHDYKKSEFIILTALEKGEEKDYWLLEQSKLYLLRNKKEESKKILKTILLNYTNGYWADEARAIFNQL